MTSTEDLLNAFMNRTATADDRAELTRRLKALDDPDAELLDRLEAEALVKRSVAPSPDLDRNFDAVWDQIDAPTPDNVVGFKTQGRTTRLSRLSRLSRGWAAPFAAAAAGLLFFALFEAPTDPQTDMHLKGVAVPAVELIAFEGTRTQSAPGIERRLDSGARVAADTPVLLAYHLSSPAWVYVLAETDQGVQILYQAGHRSGGRHEVAQDDRILALTLERFDTQTLRIELIAASRALEPSWLASLSDLDDPRLVTECNRCGRHGLILRTLRTRPTP